ncbi:MAG TPA: hypothetical protein VNB46_01810 [Gaiellaceae bacterium]|jgi:hypothetical protein|nr:hypothetical protein [Gaiellaceae bacterium]
MPAGGETELDRELDRLYELPLGEFTAARDETVKRLRAEGRRDLADQVKQVRKPTAAVWVVNRLARDRELDVQRLLKAGEALSSSQLEAASGKATERFTEARHEEQRALERLADAARELAAREAVGAAAIERAVQTLRAASLTGEGRALLQRGRLTEELEAPGFDALTGVAPRAEQAAPAARKDDRQERRQLLKEARERVKQLRSQERDLVAAARAAHREAERAETQAAALRKRAEDAEAKASAVEKERAAAESELEQLS